MAPKYLLGFLYYYTARISNAFSNFVNIALRRQIKCKGNAGKSGIAIFNTNILSKAFARIKANCNIPAFHK